MNEFSAGLLRVPSLRALWTYTYLLESRAFCSSGVSDALWAGATDRSVPIRVIANANDLRCKRMFLLPSSLRVRCLLFVGRRNDSYRLDQHGFIRHVVVHTLATGLHLLDLADHVHPLDHLAEHCIAHPVLRLVPVEEVVALDVDEKVGGRAIWVRGAGHSDCASIVLEPVAGLILDRRFGGLLLHRCGEPAA